jgi:hypothetical protein
MNFRHRRFTNVAALHVHAAAPSSTTTWNPADLDAANIVLSGGNLTASRSTFNPGTSSGVRAIASHSSGKYFAEFSIGSDSNDNLWLGIATGSVPVSGSTSNPSSIAGNIGISDDTVVWYDGSNIGSIDAWSTVGDVVDVAVDLTAQLLWVRVNGANWNSNPANDPATGTGGISFSAAPSGVPYFSISWLLNNGLAVTGNFGATAYTYAAPAGFANW